MESEPTRDRSQEMEGRLEQLGEHIDDADRHLDEIKPDEPIENATGDFEETHTHGGGEDPVGAQDAADEDPDEAHGEVEEEQAGPT